MSKRQPRLPAALDAVFERALAKSPADRYGSGSAFADAVRRALGTPSQGLQSGIVTFFFSDIEGSTRLLRRLRALYGELIFEHQRLFRAAFGRHGGTELDTQGDSFFAVFATATDAILAAAAARDSIAAHGWPDGVELRIRIGIHTGRASVVGGRYFGLAVHRAARICALASGARTLVSETTRSLLEDEEEQLPGLELRDLGSHELKDFERPVRLYELVAR